MSGRFPGSECPKIEGTNMSGKYLLPVIGLLCGTLATPEALAFSIKSAAIENGTLATVHACPKMGGKDLSPEILFTDPPEGATYYALVMDDPDAQPVAGKVWIHWNLVNIPVAIREIEAGTTPEDAVTLLNGSGKPAYQGMCPPNGDHLYRITAFALSEPLELTDEDEGMTIEAFAKRFETSILEKAELVGSFSTPKKP